MQSPTSEPLQALFHLEGALLLFSVEVWGASLPSCQSLPGPRALPRGAHRCHQGRLNSRGSPAHPWDPCTSHDQSPSAPMGRSEARGWQSPALPPPSGDCGHRPGRRGLASVVQPWGRASWGCSRWHLTPETTAAIHRWAGPCPPQSVSLSLSESTARVAVGAPWESRVSPVWGAGPPPVCAVSPGQVPAPRR